MKKEYMVWTIVVLVLSFLVSIPGILLSNLIYEGSIKTFNIPAVIGISTGEVCLLLFGYYLIYMSNRDLNRRIRRSEEWIEEN